MKLTNKEIENRFKEVGDQGENFDPIVITKFFDPVGSATWYATEYDPENRICFGYVTGLAYDEWGSFSVTELETIKRPLGLTIERDLFHIEQPISECVPSLKPQIEQAKQEQEESQKLSR